MHHDPWPSLADMYPDACVHCAGMGRRIGWTVDGVQRDEICECEQKGNEMKEIWEPVADGIVYGETEPGDLGRDFVAYDEYTFISVHDGGHEIRHGENPEYEYAEMYLPDNLRLCKRVEPEAITPEALQREGWEVDEMGNAQYVIDGENSRFITVSRIQEVWVHDGRDSVPFHHCETMQDLRALVRMLGGAE